MFEYIENKSKVLENMWKYIAKYIVKNNDNLLEIEEVNSLDRYQLAQQYLKSATYKQLEIDIDGINFDQLLDDIARYFDVKIPKAYIKAKGTIKHNSKNIDFEKQGLVYHFESSKGIQDRLTDEKVGGSREIKLISEKQLLLIFELLAEKGYHTYRLPNLRAINREVASNLIDYLLGKEKIKEANRYLITDTFPIKTLLPSNVTIHYFTNDEEARELLVEWGLITEKSKTVKMIYRYKGQFVNENSTCSLVGYVDRISVVIRFSGGEEHVIHPSYLKEMQSSNFTLKDNVVED